MQFLSNVVSGITCADDDRFFASEKLASGKVGGMVNGTFERACTCELWDVRIPNYSRCQDDVVRMKSPCGIIGASQMDCPDVRRGIICGSSLDCGPCPDIQFHAFGVGFHPICKFI